MIHNSFNPQAERGSTQSQEPVTAHCMFCLSFALCNHFQAFFLHFLLILLQSSLLLVLLSPDFYELSVIPFPCWLSFSEICEHLVLSCCLSVCEFTFFKNPFQFGSHVQHPTKSVLRCNALTATFLSLIPCCFFYIYPQILILSTTTLISLYDFGFSNIGLSLFLFGFISDCSSSVSGSFSSFFSFIFGVPQDLVLGTFLLHFIFVFQIRSLFNEDNTI